MMKILQKTAQVLILQRGTKAAFLSGISFLMFVCLCMVGAILYAISDNFGIGWRVLLFSPLAVWMLLLILRRFLSNDKIVTIYRLDRGNNKVIIEFQSLNESKFIELALPEVRAAVVRFLDSGYVGYGYTHIRFQLYLLTNSGKEIALDQAIGIGEKRELEAIARCFQKILYNF